MTNENYVKFLKRNGILNAQGDYRKTMEEFYCYDCGKTWIAKIERTAYEYKICPFCLSYNISTSKEREPPLIITYLKDKFLGDWNNGEK